MGLKRFDLEISSTTRGEILGFLSLYIKSLQIGHMFPLDCLIYLFVCFERQFLFLLFIHNSHLLNDQLIIELLKIHFSYICIDSILLFVIVGVGGGFG